MGIEWFRDLSITILGFAASGVLIFMAVLAYRLYRETSSALRQVKAASKMTLDTAALVQEGFKVVLPMLAVIQGMRLGCKAIGKVLTKGK
jgi:phage tail protein X